MPVETTKSQCPPRSAHSRQRRRRSIERLAAAQDGVVSRRQLYAAGMSRGEVLAELRALRWQSVGRHVVCTTTGPLTEAMQLRAAQLSGGPRAMLDGATALIAGGLSGFSTDVHRVSVPRGARVFRQQGIDVRQTRRWSAEDRAAGSGVPRTRPAVAAVRAAIWAVSDRQAALLLTMTVQQGLARAEDIALEVLRIRRAPRLGHLRVVVSDLVGGAQSLSELDFASECRSRGLPEPQRQVVRRGRGGRYYLDVCWEEWGVVVEIDGIQHVSADAVVPDALRHNEVTLQHSVVLRLPVLGLRVAPDDFFAQVERALRQAGCPLAAA